MIWTIEGERYLVSIPSRQDIRLLDILEQNSGIEQSQVFFNSNRFFSISEAGETGEAALIEGHPLLKWEQGEWTFAKETRLAFCPILIPLDKDGEDISISMEDEFPDGEIVQCGYLWRDQKQMDHPYIHFSEDLHLEDHPQQDGSEPLRWIFCGGRLVSMRQLAIITVTQTWEHILKDAISYRKEEP